MANDEEKGYPMSDEQSSKTDFSDAHARTLNSSAPVLSYLKMLGLDGKLPIVKAAEEAREEGKASPEVKKAKAAPLAQAQDDNSSQLSGFTKWLLKLDRPAVHPRKEAIDDVVEHVPEDERTDQSDDIVQRHVPETKAEVKSEKKKKKKHKKKKKDDSRKAPSDQTIELSEDVFSETLADLLASQGHHTEAISMYEKLRLIYPEKSRFFAAKIEELHKKA